MTSYDALTLPKLVIFTLEYTLWPFWADTQVTTPFALTTDGSVLDSKNNTIPFYKDVPKILREVKDKGMKGAVISSAKERGKTWLLLHLFHWDPYLDFVEIYPTSRLSHIEKLQGKAGIPYSEMIFYDNTRNSELVKLGVHCVMVDNGISLEAFNDALTKYQSDKLQSAVV